MFDYVRTTSLDLTIGEDIELEVHFNAYIDDERIVVDTRNLIIYRFEDGDKNLIHLCPADIKSVKNRLEEMKESVIREWGQGMMDFHAESRYSDRLH